jgi:hypothetical protein
MNLGLCLSWLPIAEIRAETFPSRSGGSVVRR